jgi:hypothetical protein
MNPQGLAPHTLITWRGCVDGRRLFLLRQPFNTRLCFRLRRQAALFHSREARAIRRGRITAEIVVVIRHRRRDVVVPVNDNRASMNPQGLAPHTLITWRGCVDGRRLFLLRQPFNTRLCFRKRRRNEREHDDEQRDTDAQDFLFVHSLLSKPAVMQDAEYHCPALDLFQDFLETNGLIKSRGMRRCSALSSARRYISH